MRIRCMELPMEHEGETARTPFVIVLDRVGDALPRKELDAGQPLGYVGDIRESTGARGVLVFEGEIQIGDDYP